jgi:lipooligosaccharide transport system permease protein
MTASVSATLTHLPGRILGLRPDRLVERHLMIYRHSPAVLLADIFEPLLYLVSIGVGIGQLVGHISGLGDRTVSYSQFVAPALLATAAMNGAMNETTFNMLRNLKIDRIYDAILGTPMTVYDVAVGEVCWALLRGALVTTGFLVVIATLGLAHSPWILLAIPAAALIGFAFASAGLVVSTYVRGWQDFGYVQLVMLPMFLFSTTFYPLDVYPRPVRLIVECLPLFQSIQLIREPALGNVGVHSLVPVLYLALMGLLGLAVARRRLEGALLR